MVNCKASPKAVTCCVRLLVTGLCVGLALPVPDLSQLRIQIAPRVHAGGRAAWAWGWGWKCVGWGLSRSVAQMLRGPREEGGLAGKDWR